eukprot:GHVL01002458.1.p1 GENE.GHVL01002458.1~~GHVL01002458.1.p1  ORF type:complete len:425 (+),score=106.32 GHVL01002458.1:29-1276(+)
MSENIGYGGGGWDNRGDYFCEKTKKLKEQLLEQFPDRESDILKGKCFWIDGHNNISNFEIKKMIIENGGSYEPFSISRATHIVADNLAMGNQRWREFRDKGRGGFKVVTSNWMSDTIKYKKLCKEDDYLPDCLKIKKNKKNDFFKLTQSPLKTMIYPSEDPPGPLSPRGRNSSEDPPPGGEDISCDVHDIIADDTQSPRASYKNLETDNPNFVENYFASSRLHFIGTWKNRLPPHLNGRFQPLLSWKQSIFTENSVKYLLHVDFDAFFVSVALKKNPHLLGLPVAVAHTTCPSKASSSELASCNYEARKFGVTKGMYCGKAMNLCPNLHVLPYDFLEIEACSKVLYETLSKVCSRVLPVSVDEAYLQLVGSSECADPLGTATAIRREIYEKTECYVSIGIGKNQLLAQVGTINNQ